MIFNTEFEFVASDDKTYYVEVEGAKYTEHGQVFTDIHEITVHNEMGVLFEEDDDIMKEISAEAFERDYELEDHSRDFAHYDELYNDEDSLF